MNRSFSCFTCVVVASVFLQLLTSCAGVSKSGQPRHSGNRGEVLLDGTWEIAEGGMDRIPTEFNHKVPVPGLVSLASPPFVEAGPKVSDRKEVPQKDPRRDAFWYRKTFNFASELPAVARLKVSKAMFGTKVYLNGQLVGEHIPCFTPGFFDVRSALRKGENVLVIRVGADRDAVTAAVPSGFDFEKERYIPGIFDSVSLITSGTPHVVNAQTAPDIERNVVRVQADLQNVAQAAAACGVRFVVREDQSGKVVGVASNYVSIAGGSDARVDVSVPIANCRLWSPEDPFLYRLEVHTQADTFATRFGMREFKFDPLTRRAMLNGKPYFLRGSNITLYRFFEDSECSDLPWSKDWVRKLHRRVKDMNWNSLRYCIGFPPEFWYDIADEEGILIQDEFPIWFGQTSRMKWPKELQTTQLSKEYREWMEDRWNHPCVVIWDASNETSSDQTSPAIRAVRGLDLSNRPWDNSYEYPQEPGDVYESHPYHFNNPHFKLFQLAHVEKVPRGNVQKHAVIINEYGWLWLNRDGTPTTLTSNLYRNLFVTNSTTAQRRALYARYLAAETEFWRSHRKAAGILHFTALGYSRSDGQTSDHWLDVKNLEWEPEFYENVRDSFEPVGLSIDFWKDRVTQGSSESIPVIVMNDLENPWRGSVTLQLLQNGRVVYKQAEVASVKPYDVVVVSFSLKMPVEKGQYTLQAELTGPTGRKVRSSRSFAIMDPADEGLAYRKPAKASSSYNKEFGPGRAVDGLPSTYWSSEFSDPAWLVVDLESAQEIGFIQIHWEQAFARSYSVEISLDGERWKPVYRNESGTGGISEIDTPPASARWVRLTGTTRGTRWGYAVREFKVFRKRPNRDNALVTQ